jgi:PAS domain S-box-containing protein
MPNSVVNKAEAPASHSIPPRNKAVRIAVWYAVLGMGWIVCSGWLLRYFVSDPDLGAFLEDIKGWFFILATALVLGLVLDRHFQRVQLAVQRIQESEAKLHLVGDNLPDGYVYQYMHDAAGKPRFTYISAGVEKVHGVRAVDVLQDANSLLAQMDPGQVTAFVTAEAESARTLTDFEMEFRSLRPDGKVRMVQVRSRPRRDAQGRVQWDGFAHDITELKQAEAALREHEQRTEKALRLQSAALEAAANAIVITNRGGHIEWANHAFTTLTGYTREEAAGRNPNLLKSGKHDEAFYQNLWRTILAGNVWRSEMINRHKDGHLYTEEATITPVPDDHGEILHFIAVKQDITERKRAELELERAHNQLLSLSRQAAIAEFATGILHNVGNVLNSVGVASSCLAESLKKSKAARLAQVVTLIREHESDLGSFFTNDPKGKLVPGYLSQLADKLSAEQATALQEIAELQENIEHIKAIITVQQDSANGSNSSETLQFSDLVEEALKMHANAFARGEIQVIRQFAELPPVMVQKHRILQILVNLIRNAIQACDASVFARKEVKVCVNRSDGHLRCDIADSGMGISKENIERVFTFGFTTKKEGHGFGLHGALLAAREMGGSLIAYSGGPGCGATFTLELPLQPPSHTTVSS